MRVCSNKSSYKQATVETEQLHVMGQEKRQRVKRIKDETKNE
jgi:hypothetical protein